MEMVIYIHNLIVLIYQKENIRIRMNVASVLCDLQSTSISISEIESIIVTSYSYSHSLAHKNEFYFEP